MAKNRMEQAGVTFSSGLTPDQLEAAEVRWRIEFPPDVGEFLSFALPVSRGWYDWRDLENTAIEKALRWPLEGIHFDVEHNAFWAPEWGDKPPEVEDAFAIATEQVSHAPKLIPLCGHRYIPSEPREPFNPVFSVYQTDIICYGANLWEFLSNEYRHAFRGRGTQFQISPAKEIRFWSWLVRVNEGAA